MASNQRVFVKAANDMIKRLHMSVEVNMQKKMTSVAHQLINHVMSGVEYHDVTGNLINSYAVGVYRNGDLIGISTSHEVEGKMPTRPTLKAGEMYDLPVYYSGMPVGNNRYFGSEGKSNYYAHEVALQMLPYRRPSRGKNFSLMMVCGAEYQKEFDNFTDTLRYAPRLMRGKI